MDSPLDRPAWWEHPEPGRNHWPQTPGGSRVQWSHTHGRSKPQQRQSYTKTVKDLNHNNVRVIAKQWNQSTGLSKHSYWQLSLGTKKIA